MSLLTASEWDTYLEDHPAVHILQTSAWGELKSTFGWDVIRVHVGEAGAQILFRKFLLGLCVAYIPKGPVGSNWQNLCPEIDRVCQMKQAILLKIEPDLWEPMDKEKMSDLRGFESECPQIQPRRTLLLELEGNENDWLQRMKQKTRYNIRLAHRKGVRVRTWDDLETFHKLLISTGKRSGFGVHSLDYYEKAYELFSKNGDCVLLLAEYCDQPLAALMVFAHGKRAWYFYGASSNKERNRMPTYILQWEAIRWAARRGCREYDLWGVPDASEKDLEAQFTRRLDGLWSVYRFKRGFGGRLMRSAGAWDRVYQPILYRFYRWWIKRPAAGEGQ